MTATEAEAKRKKLATYQACVAMWGGTLHEIEGDFGPELVVNRWGLTRRFRDLGQLSAWLVDVGAWRKSCRDLAQEVKRAA